MSVRHVLTTALWIIPLVLQSAIAVSMLRRRLVRVFPVFFCYTVLIPARDIVLWFLRYPGKPYAYVYWWGEALAVAFGLGIVLENLRHMFSEYGFLRFVQPFWILAMIATAGSFLMWNSTHAGGADRGFDWMILLERSARFLQVFILVMAMALMSRLGLSWHHYSTGMMVGFGFYSALDLTALEVRGHLHFMTDVTFELLKPAAYNLACFIWAFYFVRSRRVEVIEHLPTVNLEEWNTVVADQVNQWHRRS